MEKIFSHSTKSYVNIYPFCKNYIRAYLPKKVFCLLCDINNYEVTTVDLYIDKNNIKITPSEHGEFALCRNGSSPNGRTVCLNQLAIKQYGIRKGHYPCTVEKNGDLIISLKRIEEDA